ncbi:hypothetical protein [Pseudomonas phage PIP]|nr:hypothetical protein [Pseudomonas phage PIP]
MDPRTPAPASRLQQCAEQCACLRTSVPRKVVSLRKLRPSRYPHSNLRQPAQQQAPAPQVRSAAAMAASPGPATGTPAATDLAQAADLAAPRQHPQRSSPGSKRPSSKLRFSSLLPSKPLRAPWAAPAGFNPGFPTPPWTNLSSKPWFSMDALGRVCPLFQGSWCGGLVASCTLKVCRCWIGIIFRIA